MSFITYRIPSEVTKYSNLHNKHLFINTYKEMVKISENSQYVKFLLSENQKFYFYKLMNTLTQETEVQPIVTSIDNICKSAPDIDITLRSGEGLVMCVPYYVFDKTKHKNKPIQQRNFEYNSKYVKIDFKINGFDDLGRSDQKKINKLLKGIIGTQFCNSRNMQCSIITSDSTKLIVKFRKLIDLRKISYIASKYASFLSNVTFSTTSIQIVFTLSKKNVVTSKSGGKKRQKEKITKDKDKNERKGGDLWPFKDIKRKKRKRKKK